VDLQKYTDKKIEYDRPKENRMLKDKNWTGGLDMQGIK
jgi:hypothetical protein